MSINVATRDFSLGDVLSVMTGRGLAPYANIRLILNWMSGESLHQHQLPRVAEECQPALRAQHPELAAIVVPDGLQGKDACLAWLDTQAAQYGAMHPVVPLASEDHTRIDPIAEFRTMAPNVPILPVVLPQGDAR